MRRTSTSLEPCPSLPSHPRRMPVPRCLPRPTFCTPAITKKSCTIMFCTHRSQPPKPLFRFRLRLLYRDRPGLSRYRKPPPPGFLPYTSRQRLESPPLYGLTSAAPPLTPATANLRKALQAAARHAVQARTPAVLQRGREQRGTATGLALPPAHAGLRTAPRTPTARATAHIRFPEEAPELEAMV